MSGNRLAQLLDLPGVVVPVLTPFSPDGVVDYGALGQEVEYLIGTVRPAMLAIAAVEAQEYQYLSDAERVELIRKTADAIGGRVPIVVGASHASYRRACELATLAQEVKADAIQVLIPNRPSGGAASVSELVAYYQLIAQATALPIIAYHNPGPGGEVGPRVLEAIYRVPGVEAFKESSRNMRHIGTAKSLLPPEALYFTTMEVLLAALELDAAGGTLPPPGATIGAELIRAYRRGDYETARTLQRAFQEFPGQWMRYGLIAVMKVAMEAIGVPVGDPFAPFGAIPAVDREAIKEQVLNIPLFKEA